VVANLADLTRDATGAKTLKFASMLISLLLAFWPTHVVIPPATMANAVLMVVPSLEECS